MTAHAHAARPEESVAEFSVVDDKGFSRENAHGGTAAPKYRQWEYDLVVPHLGKSVLELGSGMGYFAEKLVEADCERFVLSDPEEFCLDRLRATYASRPDVEVINLQLPGPVNIDPVESVVAMNVLEHIEDDVQALRDVSKVVVPGGRIALFVPAYMQLYGEFDRRIGHFRRYTPKTIRQTVEQAGLRVLVNHPVNFLGGLAWWLAVRRGGVAAPNPPVVWVYDNIVIPISRVIERVVRPPFGQSVLCVAEAPRT